MISDDFSLKELIKDFASQRRPFVTLADAVRSIQDDFEQSTGIRVGVDPDFCQCAPFDFQVYVIMPELPETVRERETAENYREIFRFVPGYDTGKFRSIIEKWSAFRDPGVVLPPLTLSRALDSAYENEISSFPHGNNDIQHHTDWLRFITGVYHLIFAASNPVHTYANTSEADDGKQGNFVAGLFHTHKFLTTSRDNNSYLCFEGLLQPNRSNGDFPLLNIDNVNHHQVPESFLNGDFSEYQDFYKQWVGSIQKFNYLGFPEIVYYPVFDGIRVNRGVLRGYLGIYLKDAITREKARNYFDETRLAIVQNSIDSAYQKGTQNLILDSYNNLINDGSPVDFWIHNLQVLHNWSQVEQIKAEPLPDRLWWAESDTGTCCINIARAVELGFSMAGNDRRQSHNNVFAIEADTYLKLSFPRFPVLQKAEINEDSPYVKKRIREAISLLNDLIVRWQVLNNEQIAIQSARQTIISRILARNFSHNIGSHVKNRAFNHEIKKRIRDLYGFNLISESIGDTGHRKKETIILNCLDVLKHRLDEYELLRNEYTADYRMPLKNMMFYRDIVLPFCTNTLIMDNLASSEGVKFSSESGFNKIKINVNIDDTELMAEFPDLTGFDAGPESGSGVSMSDAPVCYPDAFPYLFTSGSGSFAMISEALNNIRITARDGGRNPDVEVCLPSEHAFYSILENFIRNSSKHNAKRLAGGELNIGIVIREPSSESDFYDVFLHDNISGMKPASLADFISRKNSPLIVEGKSENANFGLADMKINAHLLQTVDEFTEESLNEAVDIVLYAPEGKGRFLSTQGVKNVEGLEQLISENNIRPISDESGEYAFGYKLRLTRSKKVCWIGHKETIDSSRLSDLRRHGIYMFNSPEEFLDASNTNAMAAWHFALIEPEVFDLWNTGENGSMPAALEEFLNRLPFRVLINTAEPAGNPCLQKLLSQRRIQLVENRIETGDEKSPLQLLEMCWINWLKRWTGSKPVHLMLSFEDTNERWSDFASRLPKVKKQGYSSYRLSDGIELILLSPEYVPPLGIPNHNDARWVIYDQHGNGIGQLLNPLHFDTCTYQVIGKNSNDFSSIMYPPADHAKTRLLCYELIEAGLLNVMVLDERLCKDMHNSSVNDKDLPDEKLHVDPRLHPSLMFRWYFGLWNKLWFGNGIEGKRILAETDGYSLALENAKPLIRFDDLPEYANHPFHAFLDAVNRETGTEEPDKTGKPDVLVIHRTFLSDSRVIPDPAAYINQLRNSIPFIIVTTGGGSPHGLKGYYKYKSYGLFARLFESRNFSKYSISKVIMS